MSDIGMASAMKAAPQQTIGDLQGLLNNALSECLETVHVLRSRLDPIRNPQESSPTSPLASPPSLSPVANEIVSQIQRVTEITTLVRITLNEIEV